MELAAILISPKGAAGPLRDLMDRLGSVGVKVAIVDEVAMAVEAGRRHAEPPARRSARRSSGCPTRCRSS